MTHVLNRMRGLGNRLGRLAFVGLVAAVLTGTSAVGAHAAPSMPSTATASDTSTSSLSPYDGSDRIVGGGYVEQEIPWIAALHANGGFTCTASIIAPTWILTAGHCVEGDAAYSVRVGSLTRSSGGVVADVAEKFIHPDYAWPEHDIALLRLATPIETTYSPLATAEDMADDQAATLYGWGSENADWSGPLPENLKYADGTVTQAYCDSDHRLCTQTDGSVAGGDSGGPSVVQSAADGEWVQAGVCAIGHKPAGSGWAAYTSTAAHWDWIQSVTGGI